MYNAIHYANKTDLFFRNIIPYIARIIPTGKFTEVTFYRHKEGKYLYYCLSESHIENAKKFFEVFPKAIRISQMEFDLIHFFRPDIQIVEVEDDKIIADMAEYEESEDKNINDN
jgi:hypothetical protein